MNRRRVSSLAALLLLASALVGSAQKAAPPAPQPSKEIQFPAFEQRTLGNGLRVVVIEHRETPSVSAQIILPAGRLYSTNAKAGLASATASLLTQGAGKRSAQEIAAAIDLVGGTLNAGAGSDAGEASVRVTSDQLDLGLGLLADIVLRPTFPEEEIERWRRQALSGLQIQQNDPGYLAGAALNRAVFGDHPYGQPSDGTPETVRGLTREDMVAFHRAHYVPNGAILAIVGNVRPADAFARAERFFGGWTKGEEPKAPAFQAAKPQSPRILVVDKPDAVQTQILVGQTGIPYNDPQLYLAEVYSAVVGGGSNARLYEEVRTKRALSYGAYSDFDPRRQTGIFLAGTSTKTESTVDALEQVQTVLRGMGQQPVPETELTGRKGFITGAFPLEIETPEGIAGKVVEAMFFGLGKDFIESYNDRIEAVTAAELQRFAANAMNPSHSTIVLVGNASAFASDLEKRFGKFETIPVAELDLLRADLRRARDTAATAPVSDADRTRGLELLRLARQALGGQAFAEQRSQVSKGSGSVTPPGMPQAMPIQSVTIYEVFPAKSRTEMTLPFGQMIQGFDGQTGWVSVMNQVQEQPQMGQEQYFGLNVLRRFDRPGYTVRPLADAEVQGKKAQVVEVSDDAGHTTRFFVDPQSHLLLKSSFEAGGQTTETVYSDYREVGGLQIAHGMTVIQNGSPMAEMKLTEVQVNPAIDDALFKKPQS
ncbi:MAG TPA: insulinase family protein [Thermoanaerobaculia bacterium]|nr:insulinase family protein [Thermoanaerobaculia bacterium]